MRDEPSDQSARYAQLMGRFDINGKTLQRFLGTATALLLLTACASRPQAVSPPDAGQNPGQPSGEYGTLTLDASVGNTLAAVPPGDFRVHHTYVLEIPAGTVSLTVDVDSEDDADLAVKFGNPIVSYADVDYLNVEIDSGPSYTVQNPPAGLAYIDVLNTYPDRAIPYVLSISGQTGPAPLEPVPVRDTPHPEPADFGPRGGLALGAALAGNLRQAPDETFSTFHTYYFDVPQGARSLHVFLQPTSALDLFVKHGSDIASYAERPAGGDWHYRAFAHEPGDLLTITVSSPAPGRWYLDVVNWANRTADGRYTLLVEVR